jgi:hypothetical protein
VKSQAKPKKKEIATGCELCHLSQRRFSKIRASSFHLLFQQGEERHEARGERAGTVSANEDIGEATRSCNISGILQSDCDSESALLHESVFLVDKKTPLNKTRQDSSGRRRGERMVSC